MEAGGNQVGSAQYVELAGAPILVGSRAGERIRNGALVNKLPDLGGCKVRVHLQQQSGGSQENRGSPAGRALASVVALATLDEVEPKRFPIGVQSIGCK